MRFLGCLCLGLILNFFHTASFAEAPEPLAQRERAIADVLEFFNVSASQAFEADGIKPNPSRVPVHGSRFGIDPRNIRPDSQTLYWDNTKKNVSFQILPSGPLGRPSQVFIKMTSKGERKVFRMDLFADPSRSQFQVDYFGPIMGVDGKPQSISISQVVVERNIAGFKVRRGQSLVAERLEDGRIKLILRNSSFTGARQKCAACLISLRQTAE